MIEQTDLPAVPIKTINLHFDPDNPRFYRFNNRESEEAAIEDMLDDEGVLDLMRSIGEKGYFQGEPLLVTEESGKYIVIEGNRRLAAVKLLNCEIIPPSRRQRSVEQIIHEAPVAADDKLPCILYPSRKDILRYLGYRHITGIKEWDSLSKARYLANIREVFYAEKPVDEQMRIMANDIGSRSDYVAQLLASLKLYTKAEENKFYDLPMKDKDVEFSYITTALNYKPITNWLGMEGRKDIAQDTLEEENLKSLFAWMFVKDQQGHTILGESRNLNMVAAIVANEDAVATLKAESDLNNAYLYSDGPQAALIKAVETAIKHSNTAWNLLLKTAGLSQAHLDLADQLFDNAKSIRNHIRDKLEE